MASPREAFIEEIWEAGGNDNARLIYADWLDEFGTSDADHARAEFIRLSCSSGIDKATGVKVRVGVKEGRWLDANWHRLLPSLKATATEEMHGTGGLRFLSREGREIRTRWHFARKNYHTKEQHYGATITLTYWRGFATHAGFSTAGNALRAGGLVAADEPFAQPYTIDPPYRAMQNENGVTVSYAAFANTLGPILNLVAGFDSEYSGDAVLLRTKSFTVTDQRDADDAAEVADRQTRLALAEWVRANAGRSFERVDYSDFAEVTYPINYSDPEWRDQRR